MRDQVIQKWGQGIQKDTVGQKKWGRNKSHEYSIVSGVIGKSDDKRTCTCEKKGLEKILFKVMNISKVIGSWKSGSEEHMRDSQLLKL